MIKNTILEKKHIAGESVDWYLYGGEFVSIYQNLKIHILWAFYI